MKHTAVAPEVVALLAAASHHRSPVAVAEPRCAAMPARAITAQLHAYGADDLFAAIESDDVVILEACLRAGVHVEARDDEGHTGLMLAALRGHDACYNALRAAGASLDTKDGQGVAAITYVRNFGALPRQNVLALRAAMLRSLLRAKHQHGQAGDPADAGNTAGG